MSEYRPSYISPPRDLGPFKSDRSLPRTTSHNLSGTDLSYKELKHEYSKVLNHLDSIRQDRGLYKSPLESVSDTKGYSKLLSPSTSERSPFRSTGKITTTYNKYPESERRIIELEQEVSELKKLLENHKLRVSILQRENHEYQERIKDFKKIDDSNRQLGFEMKTLDHEILSITRQMRELEQENARLVAEKANAGAPSQATEFPKNVKKYGKYIVQLLKTLNEDHYGRFCFEERFTSEQELLKLVDAKDSNQLLMQSFRYIADLLLNVSSTGKASTEPSVIAPKKEGQAYLVDLNETYGSIPRRLTTPKTNRDLKTRGTPEVPRYQSPNRQVATEPDHVKFEEVEPRRRSEKSEDDLKNRYYLEDKKFEQRRRQYEDQRARQTMDEDDRRVSTRLQERETRESQLREERRPTVRDYETQKYGREENKYLERDQRQSLAQSQRTTVKDEYMFRDIRPSVKEERRYVEPEERRYTGNYSREEEQPVTRVEQRQYDSGQEAYGQEARGYAGQNLERQYSSVKEDNYVPRETQQRKRDDSRTRRDENVVPSGNNRSRALSTERQPTPEVQYRETPAQSRGEYISQNQNQGYEEENYGRRAVTEENAQRTYYDEAPPVPRRQDRSPSYQNDRKAQTYREASPQGYQSQGGNLNQSRQHEENQPQNRNYRDVQEQEDKYIREQQYEVAPKQSIAGQNLPPLDQSGSRQPELARKQSQMSESGYGKTPLQRAGTGEERSFSKAEQEYQEAPRLTKKYSSDNRQDEQQQQQQYKESSPLAVQRRESKPDRSKSPHQEVRGVPQKQLSLNPEKSAPPKSPRDVKKSNSLIEQSQKMKQSSPSPIKAQTPQANQSAGTGKMLSPNSNQVSQIVYKNSKSLQGSYSPISSSKSSKADIAGTSGPMKTEEKDLIQRENELIQRIRELREKERELMEKEREITQKTDTQFRSQPRSSGDLGQTQSQPQAVQQRVQKQTSFKEPSASPKMEQKRSNSPYQQQQQQKGGYASKAAQRKDSNNEKYYEEVGEPRENRPIAARPESINPKDQQDDGRSAGLKSILKNPEPGYQGDGRISPHDTNYSTKSPFRSSFDEAGRDFDEHNSIKSNNDRRNQYSSTPEDYSRKGYQDEGKVGALEGNHQKRLTFGSHANFDPEFTGSQNYSYVSERRETSPGIQISPSKQDKGTNYSSFKVAFGRTESKFRSPSPDPKIPSILDMPRKKRVSPSPSKYDIIKGQEYKDRESVRGQDVDATFQSGVKDTSGIRDNQEGNKSDHENEKAIARTPEKKGNAGHKLKSLLVEQKWEFVKE